MSWFINDNGYMNYVRSDYRMSNTHGADYSTAELHKEEFEAITNDIIDQKLEYMIKTLNDEIPKIIESYGNEVWKRMINNLVGALQTDIHSEVQIGMEGLKEIFYGEKCQKYISDSIMKTMIKELGKVKNITLR